jgi:hypothetical protein
VLAARAAGADGCARVLEHDAPGWVASVCCERLTIRGLLLELTLFAGVQFNGAAALGVAVKGAIGGDVGAFTDVAWLAAFFSPIVGGILAGRLGDFFGV